MNDYDNFFPSSRRNSHLEGTTWKRGVGWMFVVYQYVENWDTYKCPANTSTNFIRKGGEGADDVAIWSNGGNSLCPRSYACAAGGYEDMWGTKATKGGGPPMLMNNWENPTRNVLATRVRNPSQVIMLGEMQDWEWPHIWGNNNDAKLQPHGDAKRTHFSFADGHVESMKPTATTNAANGPVNMWDYMNDDSVQPANLQTWLSLAESRM